MKRQDNTNEHSPIIERTEEGSKRRKYIKPEIQLIEQVYHEGLMTTISIPSAGGTGSGNGGNPGAKPGGDWGNIWADPTASSTTNGTGTTGTSTTSTSNDAWTVN